MKSGKTERAGQSAPWNGAPAAVLDEHIDFRPERSFMMSETPRVESLHVRIAHIRGFG